VADPGRLLLAKYLMASRHYRAATPPEPADPIWRWRQFGAIEKRREWREFALSQYLERIEGPVAGRQWTARVTDGRVVMTRRDRPHRCPPSMKVRDPRTTGERSPH
jgi:hypothetical protein